MSEQTKILVIPKINHIYLSSLYSKICKNDNFIVYSSDRYNNIIKNIFKTDIIHLHWIEGLFKGFNNSNNVFFILIKTFIYVNFIIFCKFILKKKIVITLHNVISHNNNFPLLEKKIFKFSLKTSDAIIIHNNYSKKKAIELYELNEKKTHIIPIGNYSVNGNNNKKFSKSETRKLLNIPEKKFVVLFFGSIQNYKGISDLIQVFSKILEYDNDFYLIVAGSCNDKDLKNQLSNFSKSYEHNCKIFLDYIEDDLIPVLMNASNVGILPYKRISTSAVLLLFMSYSVPIIISRLEPFEELLGNNGIYYKVGDNEDLEKKIIYAKNHYSELGNLSRKLLKLSKKYEWGEIADNTIEIYKMIR
jgi:glycosyltransferase involved in cell wall biosynthesis